jgi:hypothetical protein
VAKDEGIRTGGLKIRKKKAASFIAINRRGRPQIVYQTIVSLIAATTTEKGLRVRCWLDENIYQRGRKARDAEMAPIRIQPQVFHAELNYTIYPHGLSI